MVYLDHVDLRILAEVARDSSLSYSDIGRRLGLNPGVVAYRVNKLKNLGVIEGFTARIDLEKLGFVERAVVALSFPNPSSKPEVLARITEIPNVAIAINSLGTPETILLVVAKSKSELEYVVSRIRSFDVKVEFASSVIEVYQRDSISEILRVKASEPFCEAVVKPKPESGGG